MSLLDRLLGRSADPPLPRQDPPPVDDGLEAWVATAERVGAGLGAGGRAVVAVLGESLVHPPTSFWFGYEPTTSGLADLFSAVGETTDAAAELTTAEADLAGRRAGRLSEATRARWQAFVEQALGDPDAAALLPGRDDAHREAEQVWRTAAAGVQSWRAVQLDPHRALGQVRWYPGCATRTFIGYSDPLGLASVQRAVEEHRYSEDEWQALRPADELERRAVDPLAWRLSSLSYAIASSDGGAA
ncbi:hypothetical protein GCM10023339_03950 [Alloalcanivorax gelatiniphagus]